jgi:hypothetical protein
MIYSRRDDFPSQLALELAGADSVREAIRQNRCSPLDNREQTLVIFGGNRLFQLNAAAALIWETTETAVSPADVRLALADLIPAIAEIDIEGLLNRMVEDGLLSREAECSA